MDYNKMSLNLLYMIHHELGVTYEIHDGKIVEVKED